jgi:GNAT superfamily N-acetyltransferase
MPEWQIGPLLNAHERGEFCCGKTPLDNFIRTLANQYGKRRLGRTYVATRQGEKRILGYYTLAAGAISFSHLPETTAKKLPKHPVPVALLGRLAVDQTVQGQGLGRVLLVDALQRCLDLSEHLGIHAVEVHALDRQAKDFYLRYGFVSLSDDEFHLFLAIKTIAEAFGRSITRTQDS